MRRLRAQGTGKAIVSYRMRLTMAGIAKGMALLGLLATGVMSAPSASAIPVTRSAATGVVSRAGSGSVTASSGRGIAGLAHAIRRPADSAPGAPTVTEVSAGLDQVCALQSTGTLVCWGNNRYGKSSPPPGAFISVGAGSNHTCGVRTDGNVVCWGDNIRGESTPPAGKFTAVTAGYLFSCGLRADGTLACWGDNQFGQSSPPTGTFTSLDAGTHMTCAVRTDGKAACWGSAADGPAKPPDDIFRSVTAGWQDGCGVLTDGTLKCWGNNQFGQTSPPGGTFTWVTASEHYTCGVRTDGALACWGNNMYGRISPLPSGTFTSASAGGRGGCAVRTDGLVACWGGNESGQATPPETTTTVTSSRNPVIIDHPVTYTAVVKPAADAGTMDFYDNGSLITSCADRPVRSGMATCDQNYLQPGMHSIVAVYSGEGRLLGSAGAVTQTVNPRVSTATIVASTSNPSAVGEVVIYIAVVRPAADGGTMAFTDDGKPIPSCEAQPVTDGTASCDQVYATAGVHRIVASYSGNRDFLGSKSAPLTQVVV
jgi:hypothetical protein